MAKTGWNRPLRVEVAVRLPELASSMQRGFDQSGLQRRSGRLRAELGKIQNYKVRKSGGQSKVSIVLTIALAYAQILDEGGISPFPRPGTADRKRMHMPWGWRMRRKPSLIRPYAYVRGGIEDFVEQHAISGGIDVRWAK